MSRVAQACEHNMSHGGCVLRYHVLRTLIFIIYLFILSCDFLYVVNFTLWPHSRQCSVHVACVFVRFVGSVVTFEVYDLNMFSISF